MTNFDSGLTAAHDHYSLCAYDAAVRTMWPLAQGIAAIAALLGAVVATFAGVVGATGSLFLATTVTTITGGLGAYSLVQCWRDYDLGVLEYAYEGTVIGTTAGLILKGDLMHAVLLCLAHLAFVLIVNLNVDRSIDYLVHARWTPWGAARQATAVAALDSAHHATALLCKVGPTGTLTVDFVASFAGEMREHAAHIVGECRHDKSARAGTGDHPADLGCAACGRPTGAQPCPEHQPRLFEAHLEHLENVDRMRWEQR